MKNWEKGQSLLELIVVITVAVMIIGVLTLATIATIRNSQLSKNQAQATKLAQEAIEITRTGRDRAPTTIITGFTINSGTTSITSWQDPNLWSNQISSSCSPCYFKVISSPPSSYGNIQYIGTTPSLGEGIPSGSPIFNRTITISDDATSYTTEKKVTAIVTWVDFSGSHESRQATILRKL